MHRAIVARQIGRPLTTAEHVHHKNENKEDNTPSNLEIKTPLDHVRLHHLKHPLTSMCEWCGAEFTPHKTKRGRKKTCSEGCRRALTAKKQKGKHKEMGAA